MKKTVITGVGILLLATVFMQTNSALKVHKLSKEDLERHKSQLSDADAQDTTKSEGKVVTLDGLKKVGAEHAKQVLAADTQAIQAVADIMGGTKESVGQYLGLIMAMSPKEITEAQLNRYMQQVKFQTELATEAVKAYQNACKEIAKAALDSQTELAACENMIVEYQTIEKNTEFSQQITETVNTSVKTTGLVSALFGVNVDRTTRTDTFTTTSEKMYSSVPVFKCASWVITEDVLTGVTTIARQGYMHAYAGYLAALSSIPSPQSFFGIPTQVLEKWSLEWSKQANG